MYNNGFSHPDGFLSYFIHYVTDWYIYGCVTITCASFRVCPHFVNGVHHIGRFFRQSNYCVIDAFVAHGTGYYYARQRFQCVDSVVQRHKIVEFRTGHCQHGIVAVYQSVVGGHDVEGAKTAVKRYWEAGHIQYHHRFGHIGLVVRDQLNVVLVIHTRLINL